MDIPTDGPVKKPTLEPYSIEPFGYFLPFDNLKIEQSIP